MGVIMRTAGTERSKAEIRRDFEYLSRNWDDVRDRTFNSIAPTLVYEDASLIKRAIRDLYTRDVEEVLVDGVEAYQTAKKFMRMLMPSHAKRVQRYREAGIPLFHRYQIEGQLDAIHSAEVQLKSGGYIVIQATEALVSIDVNSGRSTRERNIEETALNTNVEAAEEVARQLRLRDLAGLVVIDFIDMQETRHLRQVERRLKEAMKSDRARIQIGRISGFGLLELSRQRLRPSLQEASTQTCPHCRGAGFIRSTESMALQVLRALEEEGTRHKLSEVTVSIPGAVALYVLNNKRAMLSDIENRHGFRITLLGDDSVVPPDMRIERVRAPAPDAGEKPPAAKDRDKPAKAEEAESREEGEKKRSRRRRSRRKSSPEAATETTVEEAVDTEREAGPPRSATVMPRGRRPKSGRADDVRGGAADAGDRAVGQRHRRPNRNLSRNRRTPQPRGPTPAKRFRRRQNRFPKLRLRPSPSRSRRLRPSRNPWPSRRRSRSPLRSWRRSPRTIPPARPRPRLRPPRWRIPTGRNGAVGGKRSSNSRGRVHRRVRRDPSAEARKRLAHVLLRPGKGNPYIVAAAAPVEVEPGRDGDAGLGEQSVAQVPAVHPEGADLRIEIESAIGGRETGQTDARQTFQQDFAVFRVPRDVPVELFGAIESRERRVLRQRRGRDEQVLGQALDRSVEIGRHHQPADPPARHREIFREAVDDHRAIGEAERAVRRAPIDDAVIDLIGHQPDSAPLAILDQPPERHPRSSIVPVGLAGLATISPSSRPCSSRSPGVG